MFTYELARRLSLSQLPVVANVLDPGVVDTELQRYLPTPVGTPLEWDLVEALEPKCGEIWEVNRDSYGFMIGR